MLFRLWPEPSLGALSFDQLAQAYQIPQPDERLLRVNFVSSLDGAATIGGITGGLTGPDDQQILNLLRMLCDALVVGAGTLRREGYTQLMLPADLQRWRNAAGMPADPVLVAVSGLLDLDPAHAMFARAPVRPVVITHESAPQERRRALARVADVITVGHREVDLSTAMAALASRGLSRLLCEGGPALFGALSAAGLVDELCLTVAPLLAGPGATRITTGVPMPEAIPLELAHVLSNGAELFTRYRCRGTSRR